MKSPVETIFFDREFKDLPMEMKITLLFVLYPDKEQRDDIFDFLKQNDITITKDDFIKTKDILTSELNRIEALLSNNK